jgi:hypothetical protein
MTIRLYATEKVLDINNLRLKLGKEKKYYATKAIHKTIYDCQDGIAFIPLTFKVMKKFFQEVTLPFSDYVNKNYRKVKHSVLRLNNLGYIEIKEEEPKIHEQEYYATSYFLHRQFKKEGFLDEIKKINEEEYKIISLNFDEMISGGVFTLYVVGDLMMHPVAVRSLTQKSGYKSSTINHCITALRYCNILQTEQSEDRKLYSLSNNIEKISKFFEKGIEKKKNKISKMKKYIEVMDLSDKKSNVREISRQVNLSSPTVYNWLVLGEKPKINDKVAQVLLNQRLISEEERNVFNEYGLIEGPEPY